MSAEDYNTIATFVEEHSQEAEATEEKAGGIGFQVYNDEDESEEDE